MLGRFVDNSITSASSVTGDGLVMMKFVCDDDFLSFEPFAVTKVVDDSVFSASGSAGSWLEMLRGLVRSVLLSSSGLLR